MGEFYNGTEFGGQGDIALFNASNLNGDSRVSIYRRFDLETRKPGRIYEIEFVESVESPDNILKSAIRAANSSNVGIKMKKFGDKVNEAEDNEQKRYVIVG